MSANAKEVVLVLCDRIKREAQTNKAMLDGLFDRVYVKQFPGSLNCSLFIRFYHDSSTGPIEIGLAFLRPNQLREQLPVRSLPCMDGRCEGQVAIQGIPLLQAGRHFFLLSVGGQEVGRVRFEVEQIKTEVPRVSTPDAIN